jgi:hypothetical protein
MSKWSLAIWSALCLAAGGCTGSGIGLDSNGQPVGAGGQPSAPPPLTADFQSIQANIFTPICTRCHIGAGAPQGLQLDAEHSYALLVGVPSSEESGVLRVKAGDPDHSYLILKLEGASGIVGAQMPFGGPYLPQSTIDVIRQWITDGALSTAAADSGSAAATADASRRPGPANAFSIIATSPAEGAVVTGKLPRVIVGFGTEPEQSLVNPTTVELLRVAHDPAGGALGATAARIDVAISFAPGNPSTLLLTPAAPLPPGEYLLRLRGSGGGALADLAGNTLGRDESLTFTVKGAP